MRVFEIDFSSEPGRHLLAAVTVRHGDRIAAAAGLASRVFGLVSPFAPGLRFVGAEASSPHLPAATRFSLGGSGLTLEDAVASCFGEGVERLSQVEQPGDVGCTLSITEARGRLTAQTFALAERLVPMSTQVDWLEASDLATGETVLVPADWCLRRAVDGPLRMADTALSTGVAAGPSSEAAAVRAMLEAIERDAVALWWIGGQRGRPVALETSGLDGVAAMAATLRGDVVERVTWLLDVTTDLGVPCVVALSTAQDGRGLACGMAARLSVGAAARAALLELCQMEMAIGMAEGRRAERGVAALSAADQMHLARAAQIDASACELLNPKGQPKVAPPRIETDDTLAFAALQQVFADQKIDVALVDLTRDSHGVPVIVAVTPALQRLPSGVTTQRLTDVAQKTGGGAHWTHGLSLL
jgi:ribosomal protein S12 methylthiotransferase accessory factor